MRRKELIVQQEQAYKDAKAGLEQAACALDLLHRDVHCAFRNLATAVREIASALQEVKTALDEA